jgi:hypothetical protein
MLRRCVNCGRIYPSTHPANRYCLNCLRLAASSRARAAATAQSREILDYLDSVFDISLALKVQMADEFERRRRARINHARLVARGGGGTALAREYRRIADNPKPIFDKKATYYDQDRAKRDREEDDEPAGAAGDDPEGGEGAGGGG